VAQGQVQSDPFVEQVAACIDAEIHLPAGAGVLVAVSGGADSVALLAALRLLAERPGRRYRLTVAHLNHQLRREAAADADFVAELAHRWSLPIVMDRCDVAAEARRSGRGIEEAARKLRYAFLRKTAVDRGLPYVAVGHHADDNVETIVYRLFRGTHLRGLRGIQPIRSFSDGEVMLIRPLLRLSRRQIEAFCRREGLSWRTDVSNADVRHRRNFIRHRLLPMVREHLNRRADEAVLRLAAAAEQLERYMADVGRRTLEDCRIFAEADRLVLDAEKLASQPPVIVAYVLRAALEGIGTPMKTMGLHRFRDLRELIHPQGPPAVSLPGGVLARREAGEIVIERRPGSRVEGEAEAVVLECPGATMLRGGREQVVCELASFDEKRFRDHCSAHPPGVEWLDADQVRGRLVCRPRRRADAFVPLGAPGRQSVSDFLTNCKLPRRARERVRCLCDELGIVYVAPLRIDDRVKITPSTRRVLQIAFRQVD